MIKIPAEDIKISAEGMEGVQNTNVQNNRVNFTCLDTSCSYFVRKIKQVYCLWNLNLCFLSALRVGAVFPHILQSRAIPVVI